MITKAILRWYCKKCDKYWPKEKIMMIDPKTRIHFHRFSTVPKWASQNSRLVSRKLSRTSCELEHKVNLIR